MCNQALFECLALNLHCLRGDQRALTAVINHRIVSTQCFSNVLLLCEFYFLTEGSRCYMKLNLVCKAKLLAVGISCVVVILPFRKHLLFTLLLFISSTYPLNWPVYFVTLFSHAPNFNSCSCLKLFSVADKVVQKRTFHF